LLSPIRATTITVAIIVRAMPIWNAIQNRSLEPKYKNQNKEIKNNYFGNCKSGKAILI
jgi:hypothetical protein